MVLPIPPSIPPDCWVACCGGGVRVCWVGCGRVVVVELLGGGDLEPPLDPPLAILVDMNKYKNNITLEFSNIHISFKLYSPIFQNSTTNTHTYLTKLTFFTSSL
jgi:hypothetical protein